MTVQQAIDSLNADADEELADLELDDSERAEIERHRSRRADVGRRSGW